MALFTTGAERCEGVEPVVVVHQPRPARRAGRGPRPGGRGGLRRLPHRAEGGRDRHRRAAGAGRGRARGVRAQPPGRRRRARCLAGVGRCLRRSSSTRATACPTRRACMAQSLSAIGLSPERSFELARAVERRLAETRRDEVDVEGLNAVCEEVLSRPRRATAPCGRFRAWSRLGRLERPLVVLIGGTTGVGQVHARDDAGRPAGDQPRDRHGRDPPGAARVLHRRGDALGAPLGLRRRRPRGLRRAGRARGHGHRGDGGAGGRTRPSRWCSRASTCCPGRSGEGLRGRCVLVEALLVVEDEELHRGHFSHRPGTRPAERYLAAFDEIRRLQDHLAERARAEGVAVIDNAERRRGAGAPHAARARTRWSGHLTPAGVAPADRRVGFLAVVPVLQRKELEDEPARRSPRNRVGARRGGLPRHAQGRPGGRDPARPGRRAAEHEEPSPTRSPEDEAPTRRRRPRSPTRTSDDDDEDEEPRGRGSEDAERGGRARGGGRAGRRGGDRHRRARHPARTAAPSCASDPAAHSRDDVYVSPAQIRRCELRSGDEVSGPVRPARRNERHPSLVHVETVNGAPAEPPAERPWLRRPHRGLPERAAARARRRSRAIPFGRGSRVAIAGPPAPEPPRLLREIVSALSEGVPTYRAGRARRACAPRRWPSGPPPAPTWWAAASTARPSLRPRPPSWPWSAPSGAWSAARTPSWWSTPSTRSPRARAAACSAPAATLEEGGSLTVIAVTGEGSEALRWATTRIVLEPGGPESRAARRCRRAERDPARRPPLSRRLLDNERLRHRRRVHQAHEL